MVLCRPHAASKPVIYSSTRPRTTQLQYNHYNYCLPFKMGLDNNRLYLLRLALALPHSQNSRMISSNTFVRDFLNPPRVSTSGRVNCRRWSCFKLPIKRNFN
ncbi:hypothetical protein PUN28_006972 [Cardiocondyla obscurior]|uniref:Uncharacterized protein n=1 Tax=Cardiocondyla obscurior TaxID=286306 RepID=A0AAW2G734_9HYME